MPAKAYNRRGFDDSEVHMLLTRPFFTIASFLFLAIGWPGIRPAAADARPNILLIIADDLGYADLGAYGGDIDTPNIDSLAERGVLLTQFHASPMCAPTRAMLFSGNNNHVAGMGQAGPVGRAGFSLAPLENRLSDRIVPFPRLLRDAGYHTYIVGKWHLGESADTSPKAAGFTRSWVLLEGAGTHYDARGFEEGGSTYWQDDDFTHYPSGRYSTDVYTERLVEFMESGKDDGKPFLAVAAYTSPHWPLQVPPTTSTYTPGATTTATTRCARADSPRSRKPASFRASRRCRRAMTRSHPGMNLMQKNVGPRHARWSCMPPWSTTWTTASGGY